MFDGDENIGPPFLDGDGLAPASVPHISLTLSVTMVPSCVFSWLRPTRWGARKGFSPITRRTRRGLERPPARRSRAHSLAIAFAVKVGRFDFPADMIGQVSIRTRACRTGSDDGRSQAMALP